MRAKRQESARANMLITIMRGTFPQCAVYSGRKITLSPSRDVYAPCMKKTMGGAGRQSRDWRHMTSYAALHNAFHKMERHCPM